MTGRAVLRAVSAARKGSRATWGYGAVVASVSVSVFAY